MNKITFNDSDILSYNEWRSQLIDYKKSISWIANDNKKYHIFSKFVVLDDSGIVDIEEQVRQFEENRIMCYNYIKDNKIDLLIKKDNLCSDDV